MGSYNETCGVTHLPIQSGDKVVVIPLKALRVKDAVFYPCVSIIDSNYTPFYLPLKGEYDADTGGVTNLEDSEAEKFIKHLNSLCIHKDGVRWQALFFDDTPSVTDLESQITVFIRNCADYMLPMVTDSEYRLGVMFVRRDVFDFLTERVSLRKPCDYEQTLRDLLTDAIDTKVVEAFHVAVKQYADLGDRYGVSNEVFAEKYGRQAIENTIRNYRDLARLLVQYVKGERPDFKTRFVELILFGEALELLRKGWLCHTSGSGSNAVELQLHKDLAEFVLKIIETMQVEWSEEFMDEMCLEETIFYNL